MQRRFSNPYQWLEGTERTAAIVLSIAGVLIVQLILISLGNPLTTDAAPLGIISFELAGEPSLARDILNSWGSIGRLYASFSLGLDYLFIVTYVLSIGLICASISENLSRRVPWLAAIGVGLAWAQLGAGLLDATENYALTKILLSAEPGILPAIARWCAIPKFIIVGAGLVYVVLGFIVKIIVNRPRPA